MVDSGKKSAGEVCAERTQALLKDHRRFSLALDQSVQCALCVPVLFRSTVAKGILLGTTEVQQL